MVETALLRQLEGFSLTTAEILYRLPGYPRLLQSYIWQDFDLAPKFPKLLRFLNFWDYGPGLLLDPYMANVPGSADQP